MEIDTKTVGPVTTISIDGEELTLPFGVSVPVVRDGIAVALVGTWKDLDLDFWERMGIDAEEKLNEADVELESQYRNVVGIDSSGELVWHVPAAPHEAPEDDIGPYYMTLLEIGGELWARNRTQRSYRIDPEAGDLLESIPANHLRLGGQTIEFDGGWVDQVIERDDLIAVRLEGTAHPDPDNRNIYVFDPDGTERWWIGDRLRDEAPQPAPPFTNIWFEEGELRGYATDGYEYHFDPEDGTLLNEVWKK